MSAITAGISGTTNREKSRLWATVATVFPIYLLLRLNRLLRRKYSRRGDIPTTARLDRVAGTFGRSTCGVDWERRQPVLCYRGLYVRSLGRCSCLWNARFTTVGMIADARE